MNCRIKLDLKIRYGRFNIDLSIMIANTQGVYNPDGGNIYIVLN